MPKNSIQTVVSALDDKQMPAGKKKTLIAAISLFAQQGYNGTSTAEIAQKAEVSQATIFKYFDSKDKLLLEIIKPVLPAVMGEFLEKVTVYQVLEDAISFLVEDRLQFIDDNAQLLTIIFQELLVNDLVKKTISDLIVAENFLVQLEDWLQVLKAKNPQMNQELQTMETIRIVIGPVLAYFMQTHIWQYSTDNKEKDLELITRQIVCGLL